jgi:hypothetical protein
MKEIGMTFLPSISLPWEKEVDGSLLTFRLIDPEEDLYPMHHQETDEQ